eukprot:6198851-Pleurochrysis_carterae.AAC.4
MDMHADLLPRRTSGSYVTRPCNAGRDSRTWMVPRTSPPPGWPSMAMKTMSSSGPTPSRAGPVSPGAAEAWRYAELEFALRTVWHVRELVLQGQLRTAVPRESAAVGRVSGLGFIALGNCSLVLAGMDVLVELRVLGDDAVEVGRGCVGRHRGLVGGLVRRVNLLDSVAAVYDVEGLAVKVKEL